jgi:hypothetical protein
MVIDIDDDAVTDVALNSWNRPLAVDTNDWSFKGAVWVGSDPSDVEFVIDCRGGCQAD